MSNKSQFPKGAKRPINPSVKKALENFNSRLEAAKERAQDMENEEAEQVSDLSGALPLPTYQEVKDDSFVWIWEAIPEELHIRLTYDKTTGEWYTKMYCVKDSIALDRDEVKTIGECLLAAYNYENIWKHHMADFMLHPGEKPASLKYETSVDYEEANNQSASGSTDNVTKSLLDRFTVTAEGKTPPENSFTQPVEDVHNGGDENI